MNNGESIHGRPIQIGSSTSVQRFNSSAASDRTPHDIRALCREKHAHRSLHARSTP